MNNDSFNAPTKAVQHELDELSLRLTPFQKRFCDVMAIGNVRSRSEAVRLAGSKAKRPASVAHKLMQNTVVLEYIRNAVMSKLNTDMVSSAVATMQQLIHEADEDKVRFAAEDTLDRMGMKVMERKHVTHSGSVSVHIDLGE